MNNEVHGDILLWFFGRLKRHDGTKRKVVTWFSNLTLWTGTSKFENVTFEVGTSKSVH